VLVGRSLEALDHLRLRSLLRGFLRETRSYFLRILWRLEKRPDMLFKRCPMDHGQRIFEHVLA
jgi:hypothetical protein